MTMPAPMVSHDQNCHVAPHFDHLDVRNAVVLLMMLSAPCYAKASTHDNDANTGATGITYNKIIIIIIIIIISTYDTALR